MAQWHWRNVGMYRGEKQRPRASSWRTSLSLRYACFPRWSHLTEQTRQQLFLLIKHSLAG